MASSKGDDFDPAQKFRTTIDKIERPDMFAEVFCNAAKKQTDIRDCLGDLIKNKISEDKEIKEKIKDLMKEIQRDNIRFMFSGFILVITSAVSAAIGAIVTAIIKSQ